MNITALHAEIAKTQQNIGDVRGQMLVAEDQAAQARSLMDQLSGRLGALQWALNIELAAVKANQEPDEEHADGTK